MIKNAFGDGVLILGYGIGDGGRGIVQQSGQRIGVAGFASADGEGVNDWAWLEFLTW